MPSNLIIEFNLNSMEIFEGQTIKLKKQHRVSFYYQETHVAKENAQTYNSTLSQHKRSLTRAYTVRHEVSIEISEHSFEAILKYYH